MSYCVFDAYEIEERRKPVAAELGARAVKVNQFDNQPGQAGKEHDEVELEPGRYVLVPPESTRQVVAGDDGLTYVVVGAVVS